MNFWYCPAAHRDPAKHLSRVPEVTIYFWVIKCLSTALGETLADVFNNDVFQSLYGALGFFIGLQIIALTIQFWWGKYYPPIYWFNILCISICGTLITDSLSDGAGVAHWWTTLMFSVLLAMTFISWYYFERTLSIHKIYTWRREAFYWAAVLFTFALGTATGDLVSEDFALGYWITLLICVGIITVDYTIYLVCEYLIFKPPKEWIAVLCFWIAYIVTRPVGASIGDLLTAEGGPVFDDSSCVCLTNASYYLPTSANQSACYSVTSNYTSLDSLDCGEDNNCLVGFDCHSGSHCADGSLTCYTPLACSLCYGAHAIIAANVVFASVSVALVALLTITKWDVIRDKKEAPDGLKSPSSVALANFADANMDSNSA